MLVSSAAAGFGIGTIGMAAPAGGKLGAVASVLAQGFQTILHHVDVLSSQGRDCLMWQLLLSGQCVATRVSS